MITPLRTAALAAGLLIATTAHAGDLSVDDIVKRTNHASYYQGNDGSATVTMTITDKQSRKRTRKMTVLRRNDDAKDGDQRFYVYFHEPADVAKMVFLVHKHVGGDDDRWLYMPGLDLVKRIAASDKRTSFVGSDFFYEDISGRPLAADKHELVESTKSYYVLKHTPKHPGEVEFSYYKMWIHRSTFLPTKVEYYDKNGNKSRVMTVNSVAKIQGITTVTKATMEDTQSGTKTETAYTNVRYNLGLPTKIFTERYLRRAPVKYLH